MFSFAGVGGGRGRFDEALETARERRFVYIERAIVCLAVSNFGCVVEEVRGGAVIDFRRQ